MNQNHWGIIFDYQAATVALSQFTVNLRWIVLDVKLLFLLLCSRKIHVPSQSKTCYSPWNALQVIFVLFTVGTMISMMWFTIILKTSLESMKKRITSCKLAPLPCSLPVIIIFAIKLWSNPFTPKFSSVILLTVCQTMHMILVKRIWNWINH